MIKLFNLKVLCLYIFKKKFTKIGLKHVIELLKKIITLIMLYIVYGDLLDYN